MTRTDWDRRQVLLGLAATGAFAPGAQGQMFGVQPGSGPSDLFRTAEAQLAGGRVIETGRVVLDVPRLAENGNSVPVTIVVDSPMSAADHVRTIHLLSEKNPIAVIGRFHLGPRAGRAVVKTYVRLAVTQNVHAVAEMSDGTLWRATAESVVLLAACLDGG